MKRSVIIALLALTISVAAFGQATVNDNSNIIKKDLPPAEVQRIVKKFSENERLFRSALNEYAFNRDATMNQLGIGGNIIGTFHLESFMTFTSDGQRVEKVTYAPIPTTPPQMVTQEDLEDLGGVNPFALEPSSIDQYNFSYVGQEHIDELDLYVFDVTPKEIPNPKKSKLRLFTGRIWVDKDDLMIVKTKGKAVPETKTNKFPIVETTRAQIDGKYWFPVDARSDDTLIYDSGDVLKLRLRVYYKNYRVGRTDVRILDDDSDAAPEPTPKKP